jgi:phosphonate transport system permease protein
VSAVAIPARTGWPARRAVATAALVALGAALLHAAGGRGDLINPGGWGQVERFFAAAAHPRLDPAFLELTVNATLTTLAYAVLGTALSVAIGVAGGVLVSETFWRSAGRRPGARTAARLAGWLGARATLALPRGVHEVVWGLLLLGVLGLDPLVAVLAIGIPFGAVTAKVYAEILDEAPRAPHDALAAAGAGRLAAIVYGLVPPALGDLVSYAFYRFECAIRAAAVLGLIGAGGLGFQISLSFQALRYGEMWTLLYALILLSGAADVLSAAVRRRGGRIARGAATLAVLLVPWAWWQVGLDAAALWSPRARDLLGQMAAGAWPPSLGGTPVSELAALASETVSMSVIAIAISFAGAVPLAFAAARTRDGGPLRAGRVGAVRTALLVLRAVPPPVWAFVCLFVLYPGVLPGAVALGVYNLGVLGRLMAESVENLDERPQAALRAIGATRAGVLLYGALPAAFPRFVAFGLYRWEVVIRETVVVGVVGAGGLGLLLAQQLARFDYAGVTVTVAVLIALTLLVDLLSAAARRALR